MFRPVASCGEFQTQEVELVEECDHFLSFAKRSRTVQRRCLVETPPLCPPSTLQPSPSVQYNQEFWDRILQWPSSLQTEYSGGPVDLRSDPLTDWLWCVQSYGAAERRPSPALRRVWGAGLGPGSLPTPSQLIGRRRTRGRTGGQRGDALHPSETTVLHHINDLKRRQGSIDQLKTERCWGIMAGGGAEERGVAGAEDLSQDWVVPEVGPAPFTTNLPHYSQQTVFGSERERSRAPGEDPMMSFVTATADREAEREPCVSHEEFWGFGFPAEE
ncbi:hypothetical protein AAFF_G00350700 [Aldrovandia affinis]|uniref:Uncharacterized protein n=1 Tax=Aldrovandia affinis TaxID=143900 RepID=A0AAD7VYW6_9TELE|nr:hypothetical protein AAFF_G00350700 [Aldrovandia affinis]